MRTLVTHFAILPLRRRWSSMLGAVHWRRVHVWLMWIIGVMHWRSQGLPVSTVDRWLTMLRVEGSTLRSSRRHAPSSRAHVWIGSVGRHESLSLGRDRSEDTLLLEALAICTASIIRRVESRAADL